MIIIILSYNVSQKHLSNIIVDLQTSRKEIGYDNLDSLLKYILETDMVLKHTNGGDQSSEGSDYRRNWGRYLVRWHLEKFQWDWESIFMAFHFGIGKLVPRLLYKLKFKSEYKT